jgi:predicted nucleic acid-binding protein
VTEAFVLDASFALRWCFEDEATAGTEAVLTALQNQETIAWVPGIWPSEILNGLGKAVTRGRIDRQKAFHFWREIRELPVEIVDSPVDENLLELALEHNLAVYDASYLSLALSRKLAFATGDGKLQRAAAGRGIDVIKP